MAKQKSRSEVLAAALAEADKRRRFANLAADEADDSEDAEPADMAGAENPDKLRVLNDGDAHKLCLKLYTQYVSETDFENFVAFIKGFDALLFKYRGGKPLSAQEVDEIAKEEGIDTSDDSDKSSKDEDDDTDPSVVISRAKRPRSKETIAPAKRVGHSLTLGMAMAKVRRAG